MHSADRIYGSADSRIDCFQRRCKEYQSRAAPILAIELRTGKEGEDE